MEVEVYWIEGITPGRLGTMPRPRGNDRVEDEIADLRRQGVDVIVSVQTPDEAERNGLEREEEVCAANDIAFHSFPIPDGGVPDSRQATLKLARRLADLLKMGESVVIHCLAGIGRSSLVAACVLMIAGETAEAAVERISRARGLPVPETEEQHAWVRDFGESLR